MNSTHLVLFASFLTLYFLIYWIYIMFEKRDEINKKAKGSLRKVSIIIPAFNEESNISGAIESCLNLNYPKDLREIIVVSDGSTDRTDEICKTYAKRGLIRFFKKERGGKASALNLGLKKARFELFATLDADSVYTREALVKMVKYFEDEYVAAVTPAMRVSNPKNFFENMQQVEYVIALFFSRLFSFFNCIYVTPGPGSVYRKSFVLGVGCYSEHSITEDMELAFKLQKNGYKIKNSIGSEVFTVVPENVFKLFRQRLRWNSGFIENALIHKEIFKQSRMLTRFVLPFNFFFILSSFVFVYFVMIKPLRTIVRNFINFANVGFDFSVFLPSYSGFLNNFVFGFDPVNMLVIVNFVFYAIFLFLTLHFSKGLLKKSVKFSVFSSFLYIVAYPFFLAFFSVGAVFYFLKNAFFRGKFGVWVK